MPLLDPDERAAVVPLLNECLDVLETIATIGTRYREALVAVARCGGDCHDCQQRARSALDNSRPLEDWIGRTVSERARFRGALEVIAAMAGPDGQLGDECRTCAEIAERALAGIDDS